MSKPTPPQIDIRGLFGGAKAAVVVPIDKSGKKAKKEGNGKTHLLASFCSLREFAVYVSLFFMQTRWPRVRLTEQAKPMLTCQA